jgi:hypothetical protein
MPLAGSVTAEAEGRHVESCTTTPSCASLGAAAPRGNSRSSELRPDFAFSSRGVLLSAADNICSDGDWMELSVTG